MTEASPSGRDGSRDSGPHQAGSSPAGRRLEELAGCTRARSLLEATALWSVSALVLALRFWPFLSAEGALLDERIFQRAFERFLAGASPYGAWIFNYPPPFVALGAWSTEHLGGLPTLYLLRAANVAGLALLLVWTSLFLSSSPWRRALILVASSFLPPIAFALELGNLSPLVAGLIVTALMSWEKRPVVAGLLLGASCAIKPLGVLAGVALFFHRSHGSTRCARLAATIAGLTTLLALAATPYTIDFVATAREPDPAALTLSPHRLFHALGMRIDPRYLAVPIALATAAAAALRRRPSWALLPLATTACLIVTPVVWSHTLLLALPTAAMVLSVAWTRRGDPRLRSPRWEPALLGTSLLGLAFSEPLTRIAGLPGWLQATLALPVIATPLGLWLYLEATVASSAPLPAGEAKPASSGKTRALRG